MHSFRIGATLLLLICRIRLSEQNEHFQNCESVSAFAVCGDFTADGLSFVSACQQLMRSTCWGGGHASEPPLLWANMAVEMGLFWGSELPGLSQQLKTAPFCCFVGSVCMFLQNRWPRWTRAALTQRNVTVVPPSRAERVIQNRTFMFHVQPIFIC